MRRAHTIFAVTVTLVQSGAAGLAQTAPGSAPVTAPTFDLAGTWDAVQRSNGGLGSTWLLSHDGTFTLVLGAMVDLTYKVEGQNFTILDSSGKPVETQTLEFTDGHAVLTRNGCSRTLTRLDSIPGDSGLVGRWKFLHMTGVLAYEEYTADGHVRARVPIQVQKGLYRIMRNTMIIHTLSPVRAEDMSVDFDLKGDTLTLSHAGAKLRYLRARPLIPTDVAQPVRPERMVC